MLKVALCAVLAFVGGFVLVKIGSGDFASLETDAEYAVRAQLANSSSAQFDKPAPVIKKDRKIVCGFVNAKNNFGSYDGRMPYIYENGFVTIYQEKSHNRLLSSEAYLKCSEGFGQVADQSAPGTLVSR